MRQRERNEDAFEAALLEERPEISREFAAELDAWAAEGFPRREESPGPSGLDRVRARMRRIGSTSFLAPAGTVAVALVALVVGINSLGEDEQSGGVTGEPDQVTVERESSAPQSGGASGGAALEESTADDAIEPGAPGNTTIAPVPEPPIPAPGEPLKPGEERIQERTVSTTLSADPDEVDEVADGVVEVTERYDGIVSESSVNTSGDRARATFDLRVPTQNLQAFLADLSDLASVSARNEGSLDITAPFVSAEERFDEAKAEVDSLLSQLAEADSPEEMAAVKADLAPARATLSAVRTELAQLKQRADFSTVSVTITGDGDADGWSLGDAADDALSVLSDIAGAILIALAAVVPLALIGAAIWFASKGLRRRRRESALDD